MNGPTVTVLIPNWNGRDLLANLLRQLREQTYPIEETIVVDNGSRDGSPELARAESARVIAFEENKGFAAAVNRGIRESRSELIAILNNDVTLAPDWLERLAGEIASMGAWFATGKILNARNKALIDGGFDVICRGACAWRCGQGRPDGPVWNLPRTVDIPPFTAAVFRAELFRRIGGLDEVFESYLEDVEFGLRGAAKGYTGRYVPGAVAHHVGSATLGAWSPRTVRQISRNQVLIVSRTYSFQDMIRYGWAIATAQALWGLVAFRHGAGLAYVMGKIDGLRMFGQVRRRVTGSIAPVLGPSERLLYELQRETGFDWYWRLYFALT
ncbi:MAG: glycosyltransferase family 2 protein [Bryobacteraceae bacterium]